MISTLKTASFIGLVAVASGGCGNTGSTPSDATADARSIDSAPAADAPTADAPAIDARTSCDPTAPFGAPVKVAGLATSGLERSAQLSADELTVYFSGTVGNVENAIFQATRATRDAAFGTPVPLDVPPGPPANQSFDSAPTVSPDGLMLVFVSNRVDLDYLYVATRASTADAFGAPTRLDGVQSPSVVDVDTTPFITADGQELWFTSTRAPTPGVYRATRSATGFENPVPVPELNPAPYQVLSADRLTVYFARRGSGVTNDIWVAHRSTTSDGFGAATMVPEVGTGSTEEPTWLSPDNCRLYLESDAAGSFDIYVATRAN